MEVRRGTPVHALHLHKYSDIFLGSLFTGKVCPVSPSGFRVKIKGMRLRLPKLFLFQIASLFLGAEALAGPYFDAGFGLESMSSGANYFQQPAADKASGGFAASYGFYIPTFFRRNSFHIDLGITDRLTTASISSTGGSLAMNTVNLAVRVEFWRIYVGGGYGVYDMVSRPDSGVTSLHGYPGTHSYFMEAGLIWRVIPELQIAGGVSLEYGLPTGGTSPSPSIDYGLHFRFPFSATEDAKSRGVDFDGFRYPFGFMKD